MPTRVVPVSPQDPRPDRLARAVALVEAGGIVALPTETFYGLATDPFNAEALAALKAAKQRPADAPELLLLADMDQVEAVAGRLPAAFASLAEMFWPGPLTLVVPAREDLPEGITGGRGTVAIRVPGSLVPRRLAAALNRPLTGTSANRHGELPCRTALEVVRAFPAGVGMILDGGPTTGAAPSTILDLTSPRPRVLREGSIPTAALRPFLPDLDAATV